MPSLRSWMPHIIWGGLTIALALIACMTYLIAIGRPTDDLYKLLTTAGTVVTVVLSGGGFLYARKSTDALDARILAGVNQALREREMTTTPPE